MSYMSCPAFEHYYEPETVEEAVSLLARCGKDARLLAGGTVLINRMRSGAIAARHVINISRVTALDHVSVTDNGELRIGALAKLATTAKAPTVRSGWPLLHEAVSDIGVAQLRNMGTVVGNICRVAAASADSAVALLALDATIIMAGATGNRQITLKEFLDQARGAMLANGEMVTGISVPPMPAQARTAFVKLDRAKVNAAVLLIASGGIWTEVRIALGGAAATPVRSPNAEAVLRGSPANADLFDEAGAAAASAAMPPSDVRASADYRRQMTSVLVSRALKAAAAATPQE